MSDAPPRRPTSGAERSPTPPERGATRARSRRTPVPSLSLPELLAHLDATSIAAELECVDAESADCAGAALLAQTARALHELLWQLRSDEAALLWEARRRVTRMRTWLRARAGDAAPARAVALCDQTLDALAAAWRTAQHEAGRSLHDTQEFESQFGGDRGPGERGAKDA